MAEFVANKEVRRRKASPICLRAAPRADLCPRMQMSVSDRTKKDHSRPAVSKKMPRNSTVKSSVVDWLIKERNDLFNRLSSASQPSTSSSFEWIKKRRPLNDFTQCTTYSDCALVVEGVRLYVNKTFMAMHSAFFEDLFFGSSNSTPIEIPLDGVNLREFVDFLQALQPNSMSFPASQVDHLLKLAHRFEAIRIINDCSMFLLAQVHTNQACLFDCLALADRHSLIDVAEYFVNYITDIKVLNYLSDEKWGFSLTTRSNIHNRITAMNDA